METFERDMPHEESNKQALTRINRTHERISVFCRIRPAQDKSSDIPYKIVNEESTLELTQNMEVLSKLGAGRYYKFTQIFDMLSSQEKLFESICLPMLQELFKNGLNALIFTYGVTNAGKTYTMVGSEENPGILRRTLEWLFALRSDLLLQKIGDVSGKFPLLSTFFGLLGSDSLVSEHFSDLKVSLRCFEVYNDDIFDLFAPKNKRNKLKLKEGEDKRTVIDDIVTLTLDDATAIKPSLNKCLNARSIKDTLLNHSSSRSHCIFRIILQFLLENDQEETSFERTINIVDLAGAERAKRTENTGIRLKEANKINQSLSCLGRCLAALRDGTLPPYRETKLTKFLAEFFVEQSCIVMITNINPDESEVEESARVLNYSALARQVPELKSRYDFRCSGSLSLKKPVDKSLILQNSCYSEAQLNFYEIKQVADFGTKLASLEDKLNYLLKDVSEIKSQLSAKLVAVAMEEVANSHLEKSKKFTTRGAKFRAEQLLRVFRKKYEARKKEEHDIDQEMNPAIFNNHSEYSGFSTKDLTIIIQQKEIFENKSRLQSSKENF